jgi:hypothetical protein
VQGLNSRIRPERKAIDLKLTRNAKWYKAAMDSDERDGGDGKDLGSEGRLTAALCEA